MKRLFLYIFTLMICLNATGQLGNPATTAELAQLIDSKYKDSLARISAAYTWVATHIIYDSRHTFAMNNSLNPRDKIDLAFKNRRGVCENYAAIFTDICRQMGFHAVVIDGLAFPNMDNDQNGHSWSAVFVDSDWYLFDPTWDADNVASFFRYFKKTGSEFIGTHLPFDPMWQMLSYPVGSSSKTRMPDFNYKDSIRNYLALDSLQKFENAAQRVARENRKNKLQKTHLAILKSNLEIKRQEEQMMWYDQAIDLMNQATRRLNDFIDIRNSRLTGKAPDNGNLYQYLREVETMLDSSSVFLDWVDRSKATLVYGTEPAREQLAKLRAKFQSQLLFLNGLTKKED